MIFIAMFFAKQGKQRQQENHDMSIKAEISKLKYVF